MEVNLIYSWTVLSHNRYFRSKFVLAATQGKRPPLDESTTVTNQLRLPKSGMLKCKGPLTPLLQSSSLPYRWYESVIVMQSSAAALKWLVTSFKWLVTIALIVTSWFLWSDRIFSMKSWAKGNSFSLVARNTSSNPWIRMTSVDIPAFWTHLVIKRHNSFLSLEADSQSWKLTISLWWNSIIWTRRS